MTDCPVQEAPAHEPIDAVIAWVDGDDPDHRRKLEAYLKTLGRDIPSSASPTRFRQCGEVEYCVASILKNASWIRQVYIVTDRQIPPFLRHATSDALKKRVTLIDHRIVFRDYEDVLPVFSSNSIENVLWRIPDLSSRFIYFNDDVMISHPVTPDDFFRQGCLVLRGAWRRLSVRTMTHRIRESRLFRGLRRPGRRERASHTRTQELSAMALGFEDRFFQLPHQPYNAIREAQHRLFAEHPDWFRLNIGYKLHHPTQLWSIGLSTHDALKNRAAIIDNRLSSQLIKADRWSYWRLRYLLNRVSQDKTRAFICIQGLDQATACNRKLILDWLDAHIAGIEKSGGR